MALSALNITAFSIKNILSENIIFHEFNLRPKTDFSTLKVIFLFTFIKSIAGFIQSLSSLMLVPVSFIMKAFSCLIFGRKLLI